MNRNKEVFLCLKINKNRYKMCSQVLPGDTFKKLRNGKMGLHMMVRQFFFSTNTRFSHVQCAVYMCTEGSIYD